MSDSDRPDWVPLIDLATSGDFENFIKGAILLLTGPDSTVAGGIVLGLLAFCVLGAIVVSLIFLVGFLRKRAAACYHKRRRHLQIWRRGSSASDSSQFELQSVHGSAPPEEGRKLHWRDKILKKLSAKSGAAGKTDESSQPPPYESVIQPPRPAVMTNHDRYIGNMV
ncbi:hypothetical protein IF1G_03242 [Cordyceps javanica]|uniref:Uncharacterized protein n=1 Tax=Cordyceps javanica TaxID=43265 RepID=A0A545V704_9HYPO|nr:hypothetical protein IF1G_03242 [Cordyceps javanica]TQW09312.1 hypothetical protein IF2G_03743 [Cordyceps javanica]